MPRLSALNLASLAQLRLTEEDLPAPSPPCSPLPKFASPPCSPFRKGPDHSVVFQPLGHPKQSVIDGEIWPPIFLPENVRAKAMRPFDSDVFICTYPKCGTTWIQQIVHQLIKADLSLSSPGNEMCHVSPMIERMGAKFAEGVAHPRVLKTHFNHMNLPKNPNAKYIYAVRNPKDALTSYFYHNRNFKIYDWANGDFNVFFELFANGQLGFGDYFDHLITWLPHIHDDNVLFLKYEDMMEDLETAVVRIGEFLGGKARDAVEDPRRLAEIVKAATIDEMKKDQRRWFPESVLHREEFIRKGGSRDWKNHLSKEQSDRIDDLCRTRFAGTEAETWWRRELAWERPEEAVETAADDDEFVSVSRRNSLADVTAFLPPPRPDRRPSLASLSTGYGSVWSSS